jgi:hypothetical protein
MLAMHLKMLAMHLKLHKPDSLIAPIHSLIAPIVTDDLRSYGAAASDLGIAKRHERGRWRIARAASEKPVNSMS